MKTALDLGANSWNGGEFYGTPERNSLHLLSEYFDKYPEDAEKVVISIKGGMLPGQMKLSGGKENIDRSINECLRLLDGKKSLDLYECARVDPEVPIEDTVGYIAEFVKAGKLGGISLSEVSAQSIRKAHAVHPISAVEVEFSMYATEILENDVASTCAELGIPVVAYSPMGRGFLVSIAYLRSQHWTDAEQTGKYKKFDDLEPDSLLRHFPRFQPDVFDENVKLADAVADLAKSKGVTSAQIAVAWVLYQSDKPGMPTIIPIPGATTAERVKENTTRVDLSEEDFKALQEIVSKFPPTGGRYPEAQQKLLYA
jgi:pyridoxine 4-dehydrogenase